MPNTSFQNGVHCFCGSGRLNNPSAGHNACGTQCAGNASEICGGPYTYSIYRTGKYIMLTFFGMNHLQLNTYIISKVHITEYVFAV